MSNPQINPDKNHTNTSLCYALKEDMPKACPLCSICDTDYESARCQPSVLVSVEVVEKLVAEQVQEPTVHTVLDKHFNILFHCLVKLLDTAEAYRLFITSCGLLYPCFCQCKMAGIQIIGCIRGGKQQAGIPFLALCVIDKQELILLNCHVSILVVGLEIVYLVINLQRRFYVS